MKSILQDRLGFTLFQLLSLLQAHKDRIDQSFHASLYIVGVHMEEMKLEDVQCPLAVS
jgi:hypothetical protein